MIIEDNFLDQNVFDELQSFMMGNRRKILTALKTKSGVVYKNGFVSK